MSAMCVHSTKGRLRLRSAGLKNDALRAATVRVHLERCAGVRLVETNPVTGSVLVSFDPQSVTAESVIREVRVAEGVPLCEGVVAYRGERPGIASAFTRSVVRAAAEQLAERLVVVLLLAVAA